ncbi:Uncharacterised protein [Mycobacteroides abscessus]|nr:Uncharacterised protein [Mycobacteroides abscessus]
MNGAPRLASTSGSDIAGISGTPYRDTVCGQRRGTSSPLVGRTRTK